MANTKISAFTSGSPAQTTDEFVIARTGANFKLAGSDIKTLAVGAGSVSVASGKTLTASNTLTLAGTDSTTMTFPSTSATLARTDAGNTFTGGQTISGGTLNGTVLNITQTWGGTGTYTGLQYNVTDSGPANAASLLMDLQTGGTSRFNLTKAGTLTFAGNLQVSTNGIYMEGTAVGTVRIPGAGGYYGFTTNSVSTPLSTIDTFISRRGAANLRLGAADAAAPVAQTLSVQSVVAGTTNTAGANITITGSQGTGTGAGGSIIFQVAPAGSSGSAQNALSTALTIASNRTVIVGAAFTVATLPAAGTQGRRAWVTDATTPTFLGTLTGGGAVVCPVFDNGTAWVSA